MSSPFAGITLTPADLPQPPTPTTNSSAAPTGSLEFYGPGSSAVASPNANLHAEISPVFGGEGPG